MFATVVYIGTFDILCVLIPFAAVITMLVCIIRLIIAKKEKRKQMKKVKIAAVISAIIVAIIASITIYIYINLPQVTPPPPHVGKMPNLIGLTYEESKEAYSCIFDIIVEEEVYSFYYPEGIIIEQNPMEGSEYLVGDTTVKCKISKGPRIVTVPNVIGLDFEDAKEFLESSGFTVGFVSEYSDDVPKGKVIATDPPEFERVVYSSAVKVTVSGGKEPDVTNDNE